MATQRHNDSGTQNTGSFELTAAYAPEKGTVNHNDAGQILFSGRGNPRVMEGYDSDGV